MSRRPPHPHDEQSIEMQSRASVLPTVQPRLAPGYAVDAASNEQQSPGARPQPFKRTPHSRKRAGDSTGAPEADALPALDANRRDDAAQESVYSNGEAVSDDDDDSIGVRLSQRRLDALREIDDKAFSWFHTKVCLIAGVGFFADAYDIFAITLTAVILDFVYSSIYDDQARVLTIYTDISSSNMLKIASPVGTFVGQLLFGFVADKVGRKRIYGIELIIITIGTFGQALCANGPKGTMSIYTSLFIWRLILGIGIGGDYPLSAVFPSEFAPKRIRGRMMTTVFSGQGWGQFVAGVIGYFVIVGFKNSFPSNGPMALAQIHADHAWRIILALGCVPAVIAIRFRLTIPETPRFTMDIERNVKQAEKDIKTFCDTGNWEWDENSTVTRVKAPKSSIKDFRLYFSKWANLKLLLACGFTWFAVDIAFYGVALNTDTLFCSVGIVQSIVACTVPTAVAGIARDTSSSGVSIALITPPAGSHYYNVTLGSDSFFGPQDAFGGLVDLAVASMIFSASGLVLGYAATFALIDHPTFGRRRIQLLGFGVLALLFAVIGVVLKVGAARNALGSPEPLAPHTRFGGGGWSHALYALAVLAAFFMNFGPNTTTFVVPGELFPTRYRSTCHGLSAAAGKVGAIIGQFAIVGNRSLKLWQSVLVFIPFMAAGFLATLVLEETNGETLEDLSNEPQQKFIQGLEDGS
ncbi:phosphate permease [Phanerochaete sordida]|uniref:Phosphate permease n=1 Tax=Phanerochaete sordida TaxID=48140 RepID=A0A9P3GHP3_9APHY|nr:phosphate permease [Phanerochaete sordida]